MCETGDQQHDGEHNGLSDLFAPVLKAIDALLLTVIAAEHSCSLQKEMEMWEVILCCYMGDDKV